MLHMAGNMHLGYFWSIKSKNDLENIIQVKLQLQQIKYKTLNPPTLFETDDVTYPF